MILEKRTIFNGTGCPYMGSIRTRRLGAVGTVQTRDKTEKVTMVLIH